MGTKSHASMPIYVDMDGTLVKTDIAQELVIQCFKKIGLWLKLLTLSFSGVSHVKRFLAENIDFSAENLPYHKELLDYLAQQKSLGRKLILATASDRIIADKVSGHLDIFDEVLASEPGSNLKGIKKLKSIQKHSGDRGFEYIGDSKADYPLWQAADRAGFVNPPKVPTKIVSNKEKHSIYIGGKKSTLKPFLKAIRPHQWAKNTLIFLPLFFSHLYTDINAIFSAALLFICFSLCASGIYLINDLLDIESDRQHKTKKTRPFAAATLRPILGVLGSGLLLSISIISCFIFLEIKVFIVLLIYISLTNVYSFFLKNYSTIDVITLTILYTIRIIAGAIVIDVPLSPWLFNFSIFFFLSLAYMKRYIELTRHSREGKLSGRNYSVSETSILSTIGIVNGGIAIFTLSLYINENFVLESYLSPKILWLLSPLMLFWVYRAWMWAWRDKIDDDPVVFAIKDRISLFVAVLIVILFLSAKYIDLDRVGWL